MTTLPQTSFRLPRPQSAAQSLAVAAGQPPAGFIAQSNPTYQMTGADVWRVLRANMWLILGFLIVSGVGGYVVNGLLAKYRPKYTSVGIVAVSAPVQTDVLHPTINGFTGTDLTLQRNGNARLLKTATLFSEVLQNEANPIHDTNWLKQFTTAQAKQDLMDNLIVTPSLDSDQIIVEFSTRDPDDAPKVIESVVNQLINDEDNRNAEAQEARSEQLSAMKDTAEEQRSELSDSLHDKEMLLNISDMSSSSRLNVKDEELGDLSKELGDAKLRAELAQDNLNRINGQFSSGEIPQAVTDAVNHDPEVAKYRDAVENLNAEVSSAEISYGNSADMVQRLKSQLDIYSKREQDAEDQARVSARNSLLEDAREEVAETKLAVTRVNDQYNDLQNEIRDLNKNLGDYVSERDQLTKVEHYIDDIDDQLREIAQFTKQKNQTNLEWRELPESADAPSFPKLSVTMSMAIALGLGLSLGIAFLREVMDTTVRSPRDIARVGNMNVLGMVPHEDDDPQAQGARLPLVIFEAPQSMMAEQLRQVRTRLQHTASLDTTRTLLVTSPSPEDGKSTIAANLASGLALNGRRILLVDANFRRPAVHRMFNLANDVGFSDVLNKLDLFESAVQESQVPNLYVLPSGLKPTNATELLESQLLIDFIERALEEFDHVIFDSGPLLLVSETVALAPRVDGVVSVVRARTNTRGVLQRMRDSLRQIKAEHLGVVLNAVRSHGGGYYRHNIRTFYDYQNNGRAA
ncbi:MAG TPA: polysaccharide biosynthesis tyrosine autokinase [Tepidisphaeraceae bacterium]|nr:polysaccharide biosynthesis tyrosine autokinase [Tepidisphaeraceae bacterium]